SCVNTSRKRRTRARPPLPLSSTLLPPPPGLTPSPYPALFRSPAEVAPPATPANVAPPIAAAGAGRMPDLNRRPASARHRPRRSADRKSTRLNSSHLGISYAVFCLKKKKNSKHPPATQDSYDAH